MRLKAKVRIVAKRLLARRNLPWFALFLLLIAVAWLGTWILQRSLRSGNNKKATQSWLDENLNADVTILGDMDVRVNLLRQSWLVFNSLEVEHPNPTFPGKFITMSRLEGRCPPLAAAKILPGTLEVELSKLRVNIEENEAGEWNIDGLMNPTDAANTPFPFPIPAIANWKAIVDDNACLLLLRRRGYEVLSGLRLEVSGKPKSDEMVVRAQTVPFQVGRLDSGYEQLGEWGPATLTFRSGRERGELPVPVPGRCGVTVQGLPAMILPFFLPGMPLDNVAGSFHGRIDYTQSATARGELSIEGVLQDLPLSVFGLPRRTPIRFNWPVPPFTGDNSVRLHMGPTGFGAFEMNIPLDVSGSPTRLSMRGDVAALDDLPALFTRHSRWPEWLSRTFPAIEWQARQWIGFGWSGDNLKMSLSRSTAGMSLSGEGEMMNGRVRVAMAPDREDSPVILAAERIDPQLLAVKLSQLFPEFFRVQLTGAHANLTWRGYNPFGPLAGVWGTGIVFAKPRIDLAASGSWWRSLPDVSLAIADAIPDWGGGDTAELAELAKTTAIGLDQLSIVAERNEKGTLTVEFRAYGDSFGQITGLVERLSDGMVEGEYLLAGPSLLIDTVGKVNPDFALALDLLANDSLGLRVHFQIEPGGKPVFTYPFLDDAKRIRESLLNAQPVAE